MSYEFSSGVVLTGVILLQEHGQEFNGDHALQELYEYVRKYQDQVILRSFHSIALCILTAYNFTHD